MDQDAQVFVQRLTPHRGPAGHHVQIGQAVNPKLNTSGLELTNDPTDIVGHRAGASVRHQTARPKNAAQRSDDAHIVRGGHGRLEIQPATADSRGQFVGSHLVGARVARFLRAVAAGKHDDGPLFAGAVRQRDGATYLLISVRGVNGSG